MRVDMRANAKDCPRQLTRLLTSVSNIDIRCFAQPPQALKSVISISMLKTNETECIQARVWLTCQPIYWARCLLPIGLWHSADRYRQNLHTMSY